MTGLIRSLILGILVVSMAACTPAGETSPTPTVTLPSPSPTPTPQWTDEEQAALDAIDRYLEVWSDIGQHVTEGGKWNTINTVAADDAATSALNVWKRWYDNGWHLEGAPTLEPTMVQIGMRDGRGQRYYVYGCYHMENAHLVDKTGTRLSGERVDTQPVLYVVLRVQNDRHFVLEGKNQEGTC